MSTKIVNICDVCEEIFAGGDAPKEHFSEIKTTEFSIPIYSNGEAKQGLYGYTNFSRVNVPSITVSARGTIGYAAIRHEPFVPIVRLITLVPDTDIIDIKYLFYATQNYRFVDSGTSIPQLTVPMLKKYSFPLPIMEKQKQIANELDKVTDLINKRNQQLSKLDELVKARFVELFGDPIDNPLNWEVSDFKDVVYFQEGPGVRNWQFRESGIKLINIRNLVDDNLVLENTSNYLSEEEVDKKYKHFLLDVGDYVMASSGVTWGKIAEIFEEHLPLCLNTSIIRLRPYDENVISKKYLFHYIKGDAFRTQIKRLITGSAQPNFGPTHLKQISILVPPIELQNQFATFVEQTDKSKLEVQKSLDKLEVLKKALMQKYFG